MTGAPKAPSLPRSMKKIYLFEGARILDATDDRFLLKLPRIPSPVWLFLLCYGAIWAGPAVLFYVTTVDPSSKWIDVPAPVAGLCACFAWACLENLALRWSKLAPLRGRVELRRLPAGNFSLSINGHPKEVSGRRGLFIFQHERTNVLVLVLGRRVNSLNYFVRLSGGGGIDPWKDGQWDKARAELAHGSQEQEESWASGSVLPIVHSILRVLRVGPQSAVSPDDGLGCLGILASMSKCLALAGFHVGALLWLEHHGNPFPSFEPIAAGLMVGAALLLPDVLLSAHHMTRFFLGPFNRKAEEMISLCQEG